MSELKITAKDSAEFQKIEAMLNCLPAQVREQIVSAEFHTMLGLQCKIKPALSVTRNFGDEAILIPNNVTSIKNSSGEIRAYCGEHTFIYEPAHPDIINYQFAKLTTYLLIYQGRTATVIQAEANTPDVWTKASMAIRKEVGAEKDTQFEFIKPTGVIYSTSPGTKLPIVVKYVQNGSLVTDDEFTLVITTQY